MPYNAFNNTIFLDNTANTACNKIVEALQVQFTVNTVNTDFALSGCAADYFQYATDYRLIRNIAFITSNDQMYAYLATSIASLINVKSSIAYQDRIQVTLPNDVKLEIWLSASALQVTTFNSVVLQLRNTIPAGLKNYCTPGTFTGDEAPLQMDPNQIFNPGGNTLYQQGWKFGVNSINVEWTQGTAVPAGVNLKTVIRNYATNNNYRFFSDYEVEVISNRGSGNGLLADFFSATLGGGTVYELDGNPLKLSTVIEFINFSLLDAGQYSSSITYEVTGLDSRTGSRGVMETIEFPITVNVTGANDEYTDPVSLEYIHTIGEAMPQPQNLFVSAFGSYTITYSKIFTISGANLTDESTKQFNIKRTSGPRTFQIYLNRSVEDAGEGFQDHAITINYSGGSIVVPVKVSVAPTNEIRVIPTSFNFEATIGVEEAAPQAIRIVSPLPYTYEVPAWLTVNGDLGNTFSGTVDPSDSVNFAPGTYTGTIVLTSAEGTVTVPVTYRVKANSFTELLPNKINFTKDQIYVNLATRVVGSYLRAVLKSSTYTFTGVLQNREYPEHFPIFNGKASFHPGEFLDSLMDSLKNIGQFIPTDLQSRVNRPFAYYLPAKLDIVMEQRAYSNDAVLNTYELNNLLFVKGTKPDGFGDDVGTMFSEHPVRVTPNSYGIVNFIKRSGVHTIEIHVNGVQKSTVQHDTVQNSMFGMIVSFKDNKPGDLVFVKISDGNGGYQERKFYVFPENKQSYHLAWVTEHEQLELLEFTGDYSINSEYERVENSVYQNLVNIKEILETNKLQPLTANTGWLLRDNHALMDSLMRSKRAWLFLPNTDYKIPLVPQGKKMTNYDSDKATYAYNVEFLINPENDAKVYPR